MIRLTFLLTTCFTNPIPGKIRWCHQPPRVHTSYDFISDLQEDILPASCQKHLQQWISMDFLCLRSTISSMSFAPNSIKTNTCHNPSSICLLFFGKYPLTKPIFMTPDVDSAKKLPQILSVCPFSGSALFQLIIISSRVSR